MWEAFKTRDRRWFATGAVATVLSMTVLLFNRVFFAGEWLAGRDTVRVYMPLAKYWVDRVRQGEFPEWYPYDSLGQPFVAMMLSAAFHPERLLYLAMPVEYALTANTLLCYPLAAIGTFGCARLLGVSRVGALFSGITFAFSGYLVGISNNLPYLVAISTMPCVLWAAERFFRAPTVARASVAAVLLALVCFAGETQTFVLTGGVVTLLAMLQTARPWRVRLALGFAVTLPALLLSAPQILPALDGLATRQELNPFGMATSFSLHPIRLFELAFGPIFISENMGFIGMELGAIVDPWMNTTWSDSVAVGMPAMVLAGLGAWSMRRSRIAWALFAFAALTFLLMLGRYTPLYGFFYRFVPVWNVFRYPEKIAPWFLFMVALAAGFAVGRTLEDDAFRRRAVVLLLAGAGLAAVLAGLTAGADMWAMALDAAKVARMTHAPLSRWFVLHAGGTAVGTGLVGLALWRSRAALWAPLLIGGQAVLLIWFGMPLPQTAGLPLLSEPAGFIDSLQKLGAANLGGPRVHSGARAFRIPRDDSLSDAKEIVAFGMFMQLEPNIGALYGFESTNYYLPAGSALLVKTNQEAQARWLLDIMPLFGGRYLIMDFTNRDRVRNSGLFDVLEQNSKWNLLLLQARNARPRAFVVWPHCVKDASAGIQTIVSPTFRSDLEATVECAPNDSPRPETSAGTAQVRSYSPEKVEIDVDAAEGSLLVLNDAYYNGWTATVDGAPAQIVPANVAVRGVRLPKGFHTVTFVYRQSGLRTGAAIALLTLLSLVGSSAALARRKRR